MDNHYIYIDSYLGKFVCIEYSLLIRPMFYCKTFDRLIIKIELLEDKYLQIKHIIFHFLAKV